jgi:hypothetical protein
MKKSKHDRLTQPSDFGPAFLQRMLAKGTVKYNTFASNIGLIKFDITIVARILNPDLRLSNLFIIDTQLDLVKCLG